MKEELLRLAGRYRKQPLYDHERLFQAMERAAPELYAAAVAFLDRFDGGSRADTDYVAALMREAVEKVRASVKEQNNGG